MEREFFNNGHVRRDGLRSRIIIISYCVGEERKEGRDGEKEEKRK